VIDVGVQGAPKYSRVLSNAGHANMPLDQQAILQQIDAVRSHVDGLISGSRHKDLSDLSDQGGSEASTVLRSAIERLAPQGSSYLRNISQATVYGGPQGLRSSIRSLMGILSALRLAYASGYLQSVQELAHADVFTGSEERDRMA